ncbi:nucleotidyltransferase domain-containing protein [Fulvivirgaceae bacterium BMA12]|uniref:Nucleotidyltransferase domain-containing protein n=1 Tax=Agaribacillus aureus TaxID=3051825 RepID=A0ABT8LBD7_9BACT|nr:nucleotidyltransferase domain-containing protein [Fulvivirgaceae bacterium BMA12]
MKEKIKKAIKEIESRHNVNVLYACETGSRAWGFPSPDSDYDVRMIYRHEPDWYLSLSEKKDTIEFMSDDRELDVTGWDIKKCLQLLWKSNGALLERVQSPIVYLEVPGFVSELRQLAAHCYSPIATMHHYLGLARKSFEGIDHKESVRLKQLFYALRASMACKWIVDRDTMPPIVFITMLNELSIDEELRNKIKDLISIKADKKESYIHPKEPELNHFIRNQLNAANEVVDTLPGRREKHVDLDIFFRKVLKTNWK